MQSAVSHVIQAARRAGEAIRAIYDDFQPEDVQTKTDDSPLTKADLASDYIIREILTTQFPEIPYISEEAGDLPFPQRKNLITYWLVDPLDGTKEFIKKNGEFTVNIALIHKGHSVMGVVYAPVLDDMFFAFRDGGAFQRNGNQDHILRCKSYEPSAKDIVIVASRSHADDQLMTYLQRYKASSFQSMGSSLKITAVAKGDAHLYPRLAPTMEWDTAAAQIILEEAGGKLIDATTGEGLVYNKPDRRNPWFIATGAVTNVDALLV